MNSDSRFGFVGSILVLGKSFRKIYRKIKCTLHFEQITTKKIFINNILKSYNVLVVVDMVVYVVYELKNSVPVIWVGWGWSQNLYQLQNTTLKVFLAGTDRLKPSKGLRLP